MKDFIQFYLIYRILICYVILSESGCLRTCQRISRLDYFSAEVTALISDDYKKYFSATESKILQDLMNESPGNAKGGTNPSTP